MKRKIHFTVNNMQCSNCAMRLQSLEDDLPGVSAVDASYRTGKMTVTFDDEQVTVESITIAAERLGYPVQQQQVK